MTYRLIVDGNLYSRKGVFNENLFASSINTSAINGYNDNSIYGTSVLNIGNHTNTLNMGGFIDGTFTRSTINFNGDAILNGNTIINGALNVNGTFNYPNSFDYVDLTNNVSIGFNQNDFTTINLGNINKTNLNTNIFGTKTRTAYSANNCIDMNTTTNTANIDLYSNDNNINYYGARINCTGGNIATNGAGTMNIYSGTLNLPNTINSNNTNSGVNLLTTQTTGGDIILGSSSVNVSVRGSRLSVPNNVSSSDTGTTVNLFTDQTTGGDIILGSSNINISIRGTKLITPNSIGSNNITQNVSLFTDQSNSTNIYYGVPRKTNHQLRGTNIALCYNTSSTTGASPYLEMYSTGDWAGIDFHCSDITESDYDGRIICYTPATPGTSGTSNMVLMANNVGIGTTSPAYKLDVNGNSNFTGIMNYSLSNNYVFNNGTVGGIWTQLGIWTWGGVSGDNGACRLKLNIWGDTGYSNNGSPIQGTNCGNEVIIYATMLNNVDTSARNVDVNYSIIGSSNIPITTVVFSQNGTNRYSYTIYAYFNTLASSYVIPWCTRDSVYTSTMTTGTTPSTTSSGTNIVMNIIKEVKIQGAVPYGTLNLSPTTNSGEAAIGFYQNPAKGGKIWTIGTGGTGGFADDTFGVFSSTLGKSPLTIKNTGYIGIGTTTPAYTLDVNGIELLRNGGSNADYNNKQLLFGYNGTNTYMHSIGTRHNSGADTSNSIDFHVWKQSDGLNNVGTKHVMSLNTTGIGCGGVDNPSHALHIRNSYGIGGDNKPNICLEGNGNVGNTVGIYLNPYSGRTGGPSTYIASIDDGLVSGHLTFWTANADGTSTISERMRIKSGGYVGIGTTSPNYPLHVNGGISGTFSGYGFLRPLSTASGYNTGSGTGTISIYSSGGIVAGAEIWSVSDKRIKMDIKYIEKGIEKIRLIKPARYNYIDKIKNYGLKIGFIAQDVEKIFDTSVYNTIEYIPNIYKHFDISNNIILINNNYELNINDEIKLFDDKNNEIFVNVLEIFDDFSIKIDKDLSGNDIFVYGKKVNDFRNIEKNEIFTMGIVAIKELDVIVQEQQKQIENQKNEIELMKEQIKQLFSMIK